MGKLKERLMKILPKDLFELSGMLFVIATLVGVSLPNLLWKKIEYARVEQEDRSERIRVEHVISEYLARDTAGLSAEDRPTFTLVDRFADKQSFRELGGYLCYVFEFARDKMSREGIEEMGEMPVNLDDSEKTREVIEISGPRTKYSRFFYVYMGPKDGPPTPKYLYYAHPNKEPSLSNIIWSGNRPSEYTFYDDKSSIGFGGNNRIYDKKPSNQPKPTNQPSPASSPTTK